MHGSNSKFFKNELGSTEGVAMVENIMENIARVIHADPIEVRISNMNADDKKILLPMIDELKKTSNYQKRLQDTQQYNKVVQFSFCKVIYKSFSTK